jgi:polysaccharide pyruvyl transferase CsaB
MVKIAISGWYGGRNLGDEAILSAMIETISARVPDTTFHVFSRNPALTSYCHAVESSSSRLVALGKSLRVMRDCDAFILGGGGFLHKYSFSAYWMSRPTLASFMEVPVVFYSLGIDTSILQSRIARWLVGRTANRAHLIIVRDESSKNVLLRMGVQKPINVTIDPVFSLKPPAKERTQELLDHEGLSAMDFVLICPGLPGYSWEQIDPVVYEKALANLIEHIVKGMGITVVLLPFKFPEDLDFCVRLKRRSGVGENVRILETEYVAKDVLGFFSRCRFALCSRYHGNIFAIVSGVPFVSIMYTLGKHGPLLDRAGVREFGLPVEDVDPSGLVRIVTRLHEMEKDVRNTLADRRVILEASANRNVDLFLEALGRT